MKYKDRKSEWEKVGFVEGKGTTTEEQNYSFTDKKVSEGSYTYILKQIDLNGAVNYSEEVNIEVKSVYTYYPDQNYPNPFNPATTIKFGLKKKSNVRIDVFNSIGENVRTVLNEERDPGIYTINFNAVDLPSGVYIYRIESGSFAQLLHYFNIPLLPYNNFLFLILLITIKYSYLQMLFFFCI